MTKTHIAKHLVLSVAFIYSLLANTAQANPMMYSISQAGWTGGGTVSGIFAGDDLNHDGRIGLSDGEVTAYQVTFSGNASVPGFTHTLSDLQFFTFTIGTSGFSPSFPLFSMGSGYFYDADDHLIGSDSFILGSNSFILGSNSFVTRFTTEDAIVRAVPEPATTLIFAAGLIGLAAISRRRQRL